VQDAVGRGARVVTGGGAIEGAGYFYEPMERLEVGMIGLNQGMVSNAGAPFGGVSTRASVARAARRASRSTSRRRTWR